jgi:hypothetical protein
MKVTKRDMPVIGYRAWELSTYAPDLQLHSLVTDTVWDAKGTTKAECHCGTVAHQRPDEHGACGLYVLAHLKDVPDWADEPRVVGAVMGWGKVIQHKSEGWRAEYARPIAFLDTSLYEEDPNLQRLADQFGVPLLDRKGLELYVKEFGDPLDGQQ